ncbi:hypothetical protein PFISCL1PPCAC_24993, partial [Pristionchus fissidentatus]
DREVINDRSSARYLIEENISDHVFFDLKKGHDTFTDKGVFLQDEPCLYQLCNWACAQKGETIEEVLGGADFAGKRGIFKRIAALIHSYHPQKWKMEDAWSIIALKMGGVILLGQTKIYREDAGHLPTYSGFKFEQYMTADKPNGIPDTDSPIDNRSSFEMMVRSELSLGGRTLKLCCGAEIHALRGNEPIEFKSAIEAKSEGFFSKLGHVLQSEISGVRSVITGYKNNNDEIDGFIVNKANSRIFSCIINR